MFVSLVIVLFCACEVVTDFKLGKVVIESVDSISRDGQDMPCHVCNKKRE